MIKCYYFIFLWLFVILFFNNDLLINFNQTTYLCLYNVHTVSLFLFLSIDFNKYAVFIYSDYVFSSIDFILYVHISLLFKNIYDIVSIFRFLKFVWIYQSYYHEIFQLTYSNMFIYLSGLRIGGSQLVIILFSYGYLKFVFCFNLILFKVSLIAAFLL